MTDKRALLVTAGCIAVWRLLDQIPLTDLNPAFISTRLELYSQPGFFASIGSNSIPLAAYSIGTVGIGPYVNAIIVVTLLGVVSHSVRARFITESGRLTLTRWTRGLGLVLALGQSYGWTMLAQNVGAVPPLDWSARLFVCLELAAGTAIVVLLAAAVDEFGLGFGYAAFFFYVLGAVADAVHRLGDAIASNPSFEAAIRALFVGSIWTIAVCAASVAFVLAIRRFADFEIAVVVAGVFRPSQFAFAIMFVPTVVANYYAVSDAVAVSWFQANWGAFGPTAWLDVVYVAVESALVASFAVFVVLSDHAVIRRHDAVSWAARRLAVVAGLGLAVFAVLIPVAARLLETRVAMLLPLGGYTVLIVTMMILLVVRAIEGRPLRLISLIP